LGRGWYSPVGIPLIHSLIRAGATSPAQARPRSVPRRRQRRIAQTERPDRTTEEVTRAYNQRAAPSAGASVECVAHVAANSICVQQLSRPAEQDRPAVQAERHAFRQWIGRVDVRRLVFLDESGASLAMVRSHAWLPRGSVLVEPARATGGDIRTLMGAMAVDRWLTRSTASAR
jgi:hypothetical protein